MALNGRVILICGDAPVGVVQRLITHSNQLGHDIVFVDRPPVEREYLHRRDLLPDFEDLIVPAIQFPKELKKPDRSRIQDRWGKYK